MLIELIIDLLDTNDVNDNKALIERNQKKKNQFLPLTCLLQMFVDPMMII